MKYIAVTGGVVSGLGKGITISSLGVLLKACGLRVTAIKIDPYLNTDAGTMSPYEHGEVFVLDDGGEVDLDLGNYERFLNVNLTREHNITTGKVYHQVIKRERRGDYLGRTVQIIPHVTDAVQEWIERVASVPVQGDEPADVCLIEVGGTVGDIESMVFLEALRQFQFRVGRDNFCLVHVSLVPVLGSVGEQKTKPTQHGAKELRSAGLNPDLIVCRSGQALHDSTRSKLAAFCHVAESCVIGVHDVSNIYHVPLLLDQQHTAQVLLERLSMSAPHPAPQLRAWKALADSVDSYSDTVRIALVGKYTGLQDSYLSVLKALKHASIVAHRKLEVLWIEAAHLELQMQSSSPSEYEEAWRRLTSADGVLVPGGFGDRGVEGKILAAHYARTKKVPYLGVCLGMQTAVIEYARNVLDMPHANSEEFDQSSTQRVVVFMPEVNPSQMGGTMRLGSRRTLLVQPPSGGETMAQQLYGRRSAVMERHRHRYEVNPEVVAQLTEAGLHFTGVDDRKQRMEIVELDRSVHPFYFATQFHPEFKSRPYRPSPPFAGLLFAATGQLDTLLERGVAPPIHDPSAHPRRDSAEMYTAAAAAAAE